MKLQQMSGGGRGFFLMIPKALIRAKRWNKGDDILVELDNKGNIILKKEE